MPNPEPIDAVVLLDTAGHYLDANAPALELLGVSLAELQSSTPDRFSIRPTIAAEQAALVHQWKSIGAEPLIGTAGLVRADGVAIRVSYAIEVSEHGFLARMRPIGGSPEAPPRVFAVGSVLREWRAAERLLAELAPGTPEWEHASSEVEMLRGQYQEILKDPWPHGGTSSRAGS